MVTIMRIRRSFDEEDLGEGESRRITATVRDARETASRTLRAVVLRVKCQPRPRPVLQEIVESARALTGARYGLIATVDYEVPQDLVTAGLTPDEAANGGLALPRLRAAARRTPEAALRDVLARHAGHAAAGDVAE